jgi:hypothetical protein
MKTATIKIRSMSDLLDALAADTKQFTDGIAYLIPESLVLKRETDLGQEEIELTITTEEREDS